MEGRKEGFASRWSRRKQEVAKEAEREHHNHADNDVTVSEEIASEDVIIDEATLAKQRLEKLNALTDEDMPDIETLNEDSDFSGFMSTGVSEALRKMALQKLFHGKTYNIRDGLDEYDGDYTSFEKLDPNIITCDMKHILDVEAEKLLAKEEQEKAEQLAEIEANINEAENQEDALDELDKQALLTEQEIGEQNKDMKENIADVANIDDVFTESIEDDLSDMRSDDLEGDEV